MTYQSTRSTHARCRYRRAGADCLWLLGGVLALCTALKASPASAGADALFDAVKDRVYQVQVVDIASGDKYSIGSGFLISHQGQVATNFHVVSAYVHEPEKYRLTYVGHDAATGALSLSSLDVIHDLAILRMDGAGKSFLPLAGSELQNGHRIYSMGNPLDLGMTIIEGTYNGLVENSRFRKFLFSGSLNGGMSGGPALNDTGEVIGVNVSKGGEQISFLVPVKHLRALLARDTAAQGNRDFLADINNALVDEQNDFYRRIINGDIINRTLGDLDIPDKMEASLRCWGHSVDAQDDAVNAVHQHCRAGDQIYVSSGLYLGDFSYDFEFIRNESLNRFQFYNRVQERFAHREFYNTGDKEDVTEFRCHTDVVALESGDWKMSTCLRAYRKLEGLYDGSMIMASVDHNHRAAVVKVSATGINLANASALFRRMSESVTWTR